MRIIVFCYGDKMYEVHALTGAMRLATLQNENNLVGFNAARVRLVGVFSLRSPDSLVEFGRSVADPQLLIGKFPVVIDGGVERRWNNGVGIWYARARQITSQANAQKG